MWGYMRCGVCWLENKEDEKQDESRESERIYGYRKEGIQYMGVEMYG